MSGIILPGQDRQPKSEGKIELPKGYSKSEPKPEQPAAAPSPAEAPAAGAPPSAEQAQGRQPRQPGQEFLFPPQGAQVQCPSCGTPYVVPVFTIIDLGANPELKTPLLSGQINVAQCQSCGAGGALGAPLMVHEPEHSFLGVYMPMESGRDDATRQRAIGELSKALMAKVPSEARKGYMLQPQQFMDWQRFLEKLWGFEGVTPEMLRRQREQSALLQNLMGLVSDSKALDIAIQRGSGLIDRDFFTMFDQIVMMARGQAGPEELAPIMQLRERLLETTEAGKELKAMQERVRAVLARITPQTSREEVLDILEEAWQDEDGEQIVGTIAMAASGLLDYQLLMMLAERIETATDEERRESLKEMQSFILQVQEQLAARQQQEQQARESTGQQSQALLQEVLQSNNTMTTLQENAELIDEAFLSFLAANIQQAERSGATAAVRRLRQIYEQAVSIIQEQLPENLQLLNKLLSTQDEAQLRQLLKENRALLSREFVDSLKALETDMRDNEQTELAGRIKSLRAQISLMI